MSVAEYVDDVREIEAVSASEAGPASRRIVASYGFWIFLLSDIVMFSALFASYAVLATGTAGGPVGAQLFNQRERRDGDGFPSALQLYVRTDVVGGQFAKPFRTSS